MNIAALSGRLTKAPTTRYGGQDNSVAITRFTLHTSNAGNIGESGKEGNTAPGTTDNTGLCSSRTDNTAGNEYGN